VSRGTKRSARDSAIQVGRMGRRRSVEGLSGRDPRIELEPYSDRDMPLLERSNAPEMTDHLGGPETREQLERRLRQYVAATTDRARMFKVIVDGVPAGGVGFWEREWQGEQTFETGWGVFPEFQGRGIATAAMELLIPMARAARSHEAMHAFPSVDNGPSNAICRKLGFELLGECQFEYPKGHWMHCNDWRLDLR
jgi:RimJ/RimL family protein N-acetyltransferase